MNALLSVSDKTGILELAQALHAQGIKLLSTGGTAKLLADNGWIAPALAEDLKRTGEFCRAEWDLQEAPLPALVTIIKRGLDDFDAGFQNASFFSVPDHGCANAAFDGIGWVASFDFRQHRGFQSRCEAVEPH